MTLNFNIAKCSNCDERKECTWIDTDRTFRTESGEVQKEQKAMCKDCLKKEVDENA